MCDRDIFQGNVKFLSTLEEVGADAVADCLTLRDQLCGIELGDDGLEYFVSNGRQDSLIVILTEVLVSLAPVLNPLKFEENILGKS